MENLFSVIRQAGGCRDNPNAEQFGQSFRQSAIKSLLLAPKSANCVLDKDIFLASLAELSCNDDSKSNVCLLDMTCHPPNETAKPVFNVLPQQLDMSNVIAALTNENIIYYIAGYLIKKIASVHECHDVNCCIQNLEAPCRMFLQRSQTFTYHKALLTDRGDFGGLHCPGDTFVSFVTQMEKLFKQEVNAMSHLFNVSQRLLNRSDQKIDVSLPICDSAVNQLKHLFFITRLHAAAKFFSRDVSIKSCKSKSRNFRKAAKVMHL